MEAVSRSYAEVMGANGEEGPAERMFELANAREVRFEQGEGRVTLRIEQDPANTTTGGIVWEAAYWLIEWLRGELAPGLAERRRAGPPLRCLEIGSGCGLLGIALAHMGCSVLLTETTAALPNLARNVASNQPPAAGGGSCTAAQLCWGDEQDTQSAVAQGPWDVLLGTDVVYKVQSYKGSEGVQGTKFR